MGTHAHTRYTTAELVVRMMGKDGTVGCLGYWHSHRPTNGSLAPKSHPADCLVSGWLAGAGHVRAADASWRGGGHHLQLAVRF